MIFEKKNLCANDVVVERKVKFVINAQVVLAFTFKFFGVSWLAEARGRCMSNRLKGAKNFFCFRSLDKHRRKKGREMMLLCGLKSLKL